MPRFDVAGVSLGVGVAGVGPGLGVADVNTWHVHARRIGKKGYRCSRQTWLDTVNAGRDARALRPPPT